MSNYIVSKTVRHPTYLEFIVEPSKPGRHLDFVPGQYAAISFKRGGKWSHSRCFSFTGTPGSDKLSFAMRDGGKFTGALAEVPEGTAVKVIGPFGHFTIDPEFDRNIVMLASGIGITPFISMLRQAEQTRLKNPLTLVYTCRDDRDIPFYNELMRLNKALPNFRVFILVGHGQPDLEKRIFAMRLDHGVLAQVVKDRFDNFSYFICGSKRFNDDLSYELRNQMVSEDRIVTESFSQATKLGFNGLNLSIPSLTYMATGMAMVAAFIFFMGIDLVRYIPRAAAITSKTSAASTPATSSGSATTPTATGSNTTGSSTTPSPSSSPSSSQSYYSPPVSSVS